MGNDKEDPVRLVHISTGMAAVALGAATVLYLRVEELERDLGSPRAASREGAKVREMPMGEGSMVLEQRAERERGLGADDAPADALGAGGDGRRASFEERIAQLERDQKTLRTERGVPFRFSEKFARNTDDLAKQLSLTSTQRTRIEDVIGRARQRIEDVLKIPDETGKSPFERGAEGRKKLEEAMKNPQPGGVLAFATDVISSRDRKIPGRNETYGDEIDRIRKETREEIATALDAKQQEAFQQTNVDGLLGEAGHVSFAYAVGDGGEDGGNEMVVEMGTSIVTEGDVVAPGEEDPAPEAPESGGR